MEAVEKVLSADARSSTVRHVSSDTIRKLLTCDATSVLDGATSEEDSPAYIKGQDPYW